ncbi:MAG: NrdJb, partial [Stenotrophomonas acidaminiphila]
RAKKNSDVSVVPSPAPAGEGARRADEGASAVKSPGSSEDIAVTGDGASFPPSATLCHKCNTKALVIMDGCATCLNCGYSKCG